MICIIISEPILYFQFDDFAVGFWVCFLRTIGIRADWTSIADLKTIQLCLLPHHRIIAQHRNIEICTCKPDWSICVILSTSKSWSSADTLRNACETMLKSPRNSLTAALIRFALDSTSTVCVYGLYLTPNGRWMLSANNRIRSLASSNESV